MINLSLLGILLMGNAAYQDGKLCKHQSSMSTLSQTQLQYKNYLKVISYRWIKDITLLFRAEDHIFNVRYDVLTRINETIIRLSWLVIIVMYCSIQKSKGHVLTHDCSTMARGNNIQMYIPRLQIIPYWKLYKVYTY